MTAHAIWAERCRILRHFLWIFFVLSFFYAALTLTLQNSSDQLTRHEILENERMLIDSEKTIISSRINRVASDVLFLRDTVNLYGTAHDNASPLGRLWLTFTNRKRIYHHVRFITTEGMETLRVNYASPGAYFTLPQNLLDQRESDYFKAANMLDADCLYISPMVLDDPNSAIPRLGKPTVHLAAPGFDTAGNRLGMVVLDYDANDLLRQVLQIAGSSHGSVFMLNADGYWLYHSTDATLEWGFQYPDRAQNSFAAMFPQEWSKIKAQRNGVVQTDHGSFRFASILTSTEYGTDSGAAALVLGASGWYLVSYIAANTADGALLANRPLTHALQMATRNGYVFALIGLIALLIATLLVVNRRERDQIRFFSEFDAMTGALNRRAGLARLNALHRRLDGESCEITLCFLDINGLKEVNDHLGHDAGDELIGTIAHAIRDNIRENDLFTRLGGDEFLLVFPNLDEAACEAVWQRIVVSLETINRTEHRRYHISVSHGVCTFRCEDAQTLDAILNQADAQMYEEKRRLKPTVQIIRDPQASQNETDPHEQ